jgi:transglutaminase-like putative cysteine protease
MNHLESTPILDFEMPEIQALVRTRGWRTLDAYQRIGAVYTFVRDEIGFGYNAADDLPASRVLADGYGQCNTKTNLLMALLRAVGIPCRFHGATIDKALQRGVVTGVTYLLAPRSILHGYAEVHFDDEWRALEGVILDTPYLDGLRARFPEATGAFLGYGAGTTSLRAPDNEWRGSSTYIQQTGVNADFGVYESPDAFYAAKGTNLRGVRAWMFRTWVRASLNRRVESIRKAGQVVGTFGACCHTQTRDSVDPRTA